LTYHKKVITFPCPSWTFSDYVEANGNDPIQDWYNSLSEEAQNLFNSLLKSNQKVELPINWVGFKRYMKGSLKKWRVWELEFHADKKQYRILGIFGEQRKQAILLVGCYHKQRIYYPADALDLAARRARALREGRASLRERKIRADI